MVVRVLVFTAVFTYWLLVLLACVIHIIKYTPEYSCPLVQLLLCLPTCVTTGHTV
jgi:hypothetical protein